MKKTLLSFFVFLALISFFCTSAIAVSQTSSIDSDTEVSKIGNQFFDACSETIESRSYLNGETLTALEESSATVASGTYYLSNNGYKMYMKHDAKKTRGAISLSEDTYDTSSFVIRDDGNGYYIVFPFKTEKELVVHAWWEGNIYGEKDRKHGPTLNGDEVALWENDGDLSQRWLLEECGDGYLIHPGDATDLSITRMKDNKLCVTTTTGDANQIWKLEPNSSCEHNYKYTLVSNVKHLAECTVCGAKENELHSTDMQIYYDSDNHWLYCTDCEVYFSIQEHNYSNDCDANCNTCDYTRSTSHAYDNACDASCNKCGEVRGVTHLYHEYKYDVMEDFSSTKHWQECSVCGNKINEQSHSFSPIMSSFDTPLYNSDGHYMSCDICSWWESQPHEYDNDCDTTCSVCLYQRSTPEHSYDNGCDPDCNICGAEREVPPHVYDNDCDPDCNICGAGREVPPHVYDNGCDPDCNICGAGREVPPHLYDNGCDPDCNICGAGREVSPHLYDNDCDPDCNICGAEREVPPHVYDNGCDPDCNICGYIRDAGHIFDEGVITKEPTIIKQGEITYTCSVCGEKKCEFLRFTIDIDDILARNVDIKTVIIVSACVAVVFIALTAIIMKKRR